MTYQVMPGTLVPTVALTFDLSFSMVGWALVVLLGCGFAMLAWYATADWRASVTPAWWTLSASRWRSRSAVADVRPRSLRP